MKTLKPTEKLAKVIQYLEQKQVKQLREMQLQFDALIDTTKPINIVNNALNDFKNSPNVQTNFFNSIASIATGYISRKLIVANSSSSIKKIGGYALQYLITNYVSKKIN